jgi:hypothetical protein
VLNLVQQVKDVTKMKLWQKICTYSLIGVASIALLSGCQTKSTEKNSSNHKNNETEKKVPVSFVKSSYQKSRIWYVVDASTFNKSQQKTIPDFVAIVKDGTAKAYRTLDYETEYSYQLDGQYRDQKKFVDIGTYAKLNDNQVKTQIGISDQAQYQLNKLALNDTSPDQNVESYQAPQFVKLNTKVNHLGETVTIPNGMRPKIMNTASSNVALDQDQIDLSFDLGEPLKKAITINHQKFIGYQSQNGNFIYLTKQLTGDSLAKHDQLK